MNSNELANVEGQGPNFRIIKKAKVGKSPGGGYNSIWYYYTVQEKVKYPGLVEFTTLTTISSNVWKDVFPMGTDFPNLEDASKFMKAYAEEVRYNSVPEIVMEMV